MASAGEKDGPSGQSGPGPSDRSEPASTSETGDDRGEDTKVSNPEDFLGGDFADSSHAATVVSSDARERLARLEQNPPKPPARDHGSGQDATDEGEATIAQPDILAAMSGDDEEDDRTAPGARPPTLQPAGGDEPADGAEPVAPDGPARPQVAYPIQSGPPVKHYPDLSPNRSPRPPAPSPPPAAGPVAVDYPRISRDSSSGYRHYSMPVGAERPSAAPPSAASSPRRKHVVGMAACGAGGLVLGLLIGLAIGGGGEGAQTTHAGKAAASVIDAGATSAPPRDAAVVVQDASVVVKDASVCVPGQPGCPASQPATPEGVIIGKSTRLERPVLATIEAPVRGTVTRAHVENKARVDRGAKLFSVRAASRRARPRVHTLESPVAGLIGQSVERGKDVDEGEVLAVVLDRKTWQATIEVSSDAVRPEWSCQAATPEHTHQARCEIDSSERTGGRTRVDLTIRSKDAPWLIAPDHPLVIELTPPAGAAGSDPVEGRK